MSLIETVSLVLGTWGALWDQFIATPFAPLALIASLVCRSRRQRAIERDLLIHGIAIIDVPPKDVPALPASISILGR